MKRVQALRYAAWLPFAWVGVVACAPAPSVDDAGTDAGPSFQCEARPNGDEVFVCRRNIECGGGSICVKADDADEFGCCEKIFCTVNADCDESENCDVRRGICVPKDLCDPGAGCANGNLCVYQDGAPQCIESAPAAASCVISPAKLFTTHAASVEVMASGYDAAGKLVPHTAFTFAVSGLTNGSATANAVSGECTDAAPCEGTITATSGAASCTASLMVYPAVATADVRVTVIDQIAGQALANTRVAAFVNGNLVEGTTDANGSYVFTGAAGTTTAVSAFPTAHQWQSVISPASNDVALFTVPVPDETKVAGVKGQFDFDSVSTTGDIKLGLAGTSITGSITDLDFATLLGEIADYTIDVEGVADNEIVPLPSGLVLELGPEKIKGDFVTFGEPGRRTLWGLGGRVRLSEVGSIISSVTASPEVNIGSILSAVLPFFSRFDHAVVSGLNLSEGARPAAPADGSPVPYGTWNFTELGGANAVKLNTLLSQSANYDLPKLPCKPGAAGAGGTCTAFASGAVVLSGVIVPGEGVVPLGLTAGLDDPDDQDAQDQADGLVDYKGENQPAKGKVVVDFAPPHDGLEGNLYLTIAIGLDIDGLTTGTLSASTITHITRSYSEANTFPNGFVEQQGGTYTKGASFALNAVGSADFYRVNFEAEDALHEWNVWFPPSVTGFNLADLRPGDLSGRDAAADVEAFKLGNGYSGAKPADFGALTTFNGTNADGLLYYMGGWSSLACLAASEDNPTPLCAAVE